MFTVLKAVEAPVALVKASVSAMNDVATFSTMLLDQPAFQMAVTCIHVASHLTGAQEQLPCGSLSSSALADVRTASQPVVHWYEAIGVRKEDVDRLGQMIEAALSDARTYVDSNRLTQDISDEKFLT